MELIGKNLMLPLPANIILLKSLLIISFLLHIIFVNFTIGCSFFSILFNILNRKKNNKNYLKFSSGLITTVTINKSIAVVLGVAPLLLISLLYTIFFYTANILLAKFWLSIILLLIISFICLYIYKFSFNYKNYFVHIISGIIGTSILFIIPLIFLANINLMLYPQKWFSISFNPLKAFIIPNVIPRYLHFITASFAITGFFIYFLFTKRYRKNIINKEYYLFIRKFALYLFLIPTLLQPIFGGIVLFTLPEIALSKSVFVLAASGLGITFILCLVIYGLIYNIDKYNLFVLKILLLLILLIMVMNRHLIRKNALTMPQEIFKKNTYKFKKQIEEFNFIKNKNQKNEIYKLDGKSVFEENCSACHSFNEALIGPAYKNVLPKYLNNKDKLKKFIANPVKVNKDFPNMPNIDLNDGQFNALFDYFVNKLKPKQNNISSKKEISKKKKNQQGSNNKETASDKNKINPEKIKSKNIEIKKTHKSVKKEIELPQTPKKDFSKGKAVFEEWCAMCHSFNEDSMGPALNNVLPKYVNNIENLKNFIKNPKKINPDFGQMPELGLADKDIEEVSQFLLNTKNK